MASKEQQELVNWIIKELRSVNPYTRKEAGNIYAYGFLASYLASVMLRDPQLRHEFRRHIERLRNKQRRP